MTDTVITPAMFKQKRTFLAYHKLEEDLERFLSYGDGDRNAAVQAALHKLAAVLCENIGQVNSAAVIRHRFGQLVPLALNVISSSAKRGKNKTRRIDAESTATLMAPPAPNPSAVAPVKEMSAGEAMQTLGSVLVQPEAPMPAVKLVKGVPTRRPGRPRKDEAPPELPKKNWRGPIPVYVLDYLKKKKKVGGRPPMKAKAWLDAHPAAWHMVA